MSLNPNKSAITQIEVSMREIDRVYDLTGFNALALGPDGKPELLTRQPDFSVFRANPFNFLNDAGEEVSRPARLKPVPGVYRSVRLEGYAPFLRTFARSESQKIDRKFVYVWSADSSRASVVELEHELYFENGDFRVVPFASPANKGKDIRPPEGERRSRLLLDVVSFWGGSQEKERLYRWQSRQRPAPQPDPEERPAARENDVRHAPGRPLQGGRHPQRPHAPAPQ